jgi:hypothetical protein
MRYVEENGLRILTSEYGKLLYDEKTDTYYKRVFLGKFASPDDYTEVVDPDASPNLVVELKNGEETNETQDFMIDTTMMALDELFLIFEPLLAAVPMTTSLRREEANPMVELYVVMIQRGLKTIDQVPERYKAEVQVLLDIIEE